jgi:histidinol-phosphate aminotransferase
MAGAIAAIDDQDYLKRISKAVIQTRENLIKDLHELGFETIPSHANFVFTKHPTKDAAAIAAALREKHIIVRHFKMARIDQYLRITIGTDEQCATLVKHLVELLK